MNEAPPIGLRPHWLWLEARIEEIDAACQRYMQGDKSIPEEWMRERQWLTGLLEETGR